MDCIAGMYVLRAGVAREFLAGIAHVFANTLRMVSGLKGKRTMWYTHCGPYDGITAGARLSQSAILFT